MERESRGEWRRGWPLVLAAMLGIGFGPGLFQNVSSLFIDGVTREMVESHFKPVSNDLFFD